MKVIEEAGPLWRKRLTVAVSVLAIGGFGAGVMGCGDDDNESGIEDAAEEVDEAAGDAADAAEEGAEDVGDAADDAVDDLNDDDDDDENNGDDDNSGGVEPGDDG